MHHDHDLQQKYTQLLEIVVAFGCERFNAAYFTIWPFFTYDSDNNVDLDKTFSAIFSFFIVFTYLL